MLSLSILLFLAADFIKAPPAIPTDSGAIVVSDEDGRQRWTAKWTMEPGERNGRHIIRFTETGQGRVSPFKQEIRWSLEAIWSAESTLQPLESEKIITTRAGKWLATERKHFDFSKGKVLFERKSSSDEPIVKSLSVPADTLAVEGIAGVLRFLPFDRSEPLRAHLLSNEPRLYSIKFENRGKERVETQAGKFDAYRIELVPNLGALNLFRSFFPKTFFWFTAAPPHFWVRYEGPENGPRTPEIVMEPEKDHD